MYSGDLSEHEALHPKPTEHFTIHPRLKHLYRTHMAMDCACIAAPFKFIWLVLWPIFSVLLGIIFGCVVSVLITSVVFLLTLLRTPMHLAKMLYVTATTEECFSGGYLSGISRLVVFLLVPLMHLLFLVGITVFSATVGTLYYIGKTTKVFYKHEYRKSMKKIESNARLEPKSPLGKYIKGCKEYMEDDEASHPVIYFLKWSFAMIPALFLSSLAIMPFSLTVLGITLYRLPINVYKTMKIALFTVILKWDLRMFVLVTLPVIHTLFPMVAFLCAIMGSFGWAWFQTTWNIFDDKNPFRKWGELKDALKEYLKTHREFVDVRCNRYDHPSGIPYGWNGRSYGIEIERILRWQKDFLVCCCLIVLEAPICLIGVSLVSAIKYIPSCLVSWKKYLEEFCCGDNSCVSILSVWPFHILAIILMPVLILIAHLFLLLFSMVRLPFQVPWVYLDRNRVICAAWEIQYEIINDHDEFTGNFCDDWKILEGLACGSAGIGGSTSMSGIQTNEQTEERKPTAPYWDRFALQSISTTAWLIEGGWVNLEDVQGMAPSAIQSIPAVAILTVLVDSVNEKDIQKGDLKWNIDGTICRENERPVCDGISNLLCPLVFEIKSILEANKKKILTSENIDVLKAMLCANREAEPEKIKRILSEADSGRQTLNNKIRTKINNLVLALLRVAPFQARMEEIFTYQYSEPDIERGPTGSQAGDDKEDNGDTSLENAGETVGEVAVEETAERGTSVVQEGCVVF